MAAPAHKDGTATFGKLLIRCMCHRGCGWSMFHRSICPFSFVVSSMRGLVMNLAKIPETSSLYCLIRCGSQQYFSKPIQCCAQNMYTNIPMNEEFLFYVDPSSVVTVELHLRAEYRKNVNRFNPRRMLQSSTGSFRKLVQRSASRAGHQHTTGTDASGATSHQQQGPAASSFQEETICRIELPIAEFQDKCQTAPLDRKWSWEPVERATMDATGARDHHGRSHSRSSSRLIEAGQFLFSKLQRSGSILDRPMSRVGTGDLGSNIELSETGTLQMQMFYVPNLHSAAEAQTVPDKMQDIPDWLSRKQWFKTCWHQGYLSQQGGDLKNWRRRYFKIIGSKMEAYHEFVCTSMCCVVCVCVLICSSSARPRNTEPPLTCPMPPRSTRSTCVWTPSRIL